MQTVSPTSWGIATYMILEVILMMKRKWIVFTLALILVILGLGTVWAQTQDISILLKPSLEMDQVYEFRDGIAAVKVFDEDYAFRLGFVDRDGQFVIPFRAYEIDPLWQTPQFSYGLVPLPIATGGVVGFFDLAGEAITPFMYEEARGFSEGLAAVSYDGQWGFIDIYGDVQIDFRYDRAGDFSEGVAPVMLNGRWGFVDTAGELAIPFVLEDYPDDDFIHPGFFEGLAPVIVSGDNGIRWGYLNRMGNRIYTYLYTSSNAFADGLALVTRIDAAGNEVFGYINQTGEEIVPPVYDMGRCFSEGLAAVMFNDRWGFVDTYGRVQVPVRYDYARSFKSGFAAVQNEGFWGFIDRWGNEIVPSVYDEVGDFAYGLAPIRLGEGEEARWGYVNTRGDVVIQVEYLDATVFSEGLAWVRNADGWGILEVLQGELSYAAEGIRYMYAPVADHLRFIPQPHTLIAIDCPQSTSEALRDMIIGLTIEQRSSGYALNTITLSIENKIRRGTSQYLPEDGILSVELIENAAYTAQNLWQTALAITNSENFSLLRQLEIGVNFIATDDDIAITFPDDVSEIGFDYLTVETEFASVTVRRDDIIPGAVINLERGAPVRLPEPVFMGVVVQDFLANPVDYLLEYWAVMAIIFLVIVWGTLASFGHRLRLWVVPTFMAIFILGNLWTLHERSEEYEEPPAIDEGYIDSVIITMSPGVRAVVSFPLNGVNHQGLMIICERGVPQMSKYNPVTGNIDARIITGGTYSFARMEYSFADIDDTDPIVREAVLSLSSMGIMTGDGDYFHPDSTITRGDLAAALVAILDLGTETTNAFPDNSPEDLHYRAITTVAYHGLINGFGDGNFRGNWAIPKSDLIVVLARALTEHMGYWSPEDASAALARYQDWDRIDPRAQDSVALVTLAGILAEREDGRFASESVMSRGDAAVLIYRLLERVW